MRLYAKQIRSAIMTRLQDAVLGLNAKLQAIDAGYSVWPSNKVAVFSPWPENRQFPECSVYVGSSQIIELPTLNINAMGVAYTCTIEITTKNAGRAKLQDIMDSYEQAVIEVLHGADLGATFIHFDNWTKGTFVDTQNSGATFDGVAFTFTIRIN